MHTCIDARICNDVDMRVYKHLRIYVCDAMPLAADTNRVRPAHRGRSKTQRPSTRNCVDPYVFEPMSRKLRSTCCYLKLNITFQNLGPPAKRSIGPKIKKIPGRKSSKTMRKFLRLLIKRYAARRAASAAPILDFQR